MLNNNFSVFSKSNSDLNKLSSFYTPGNGSVAIAWRKSLNCSISVMKSTGTDRMCVIKYIGTDTNINIIGVYMPHRSCKVADFSDDLAALEAIIESNGNEQFVIIGDWNCHVGKNKFSSSRTWGNSTVSGEKLTHFCNGYDLNLIDLHEICKGPNYTYQNTLGHQSYIDHCVISNSLVSAVVNCDVFEENVKNTSDHLPIQIEISCSSKINNKNTNTTEASKVKWHSFTQDQITNLNTNPMEVKVQQYIRSNAVFLHNVEQWSTEDIDTCCETVIKLINDINDKLPRHSCKTGTKPYWSK